MAVGSMEFNQSWVSVVAKKLKYFHLSHVVHDLKLLHQEDTHPCFYHVTACHIPTDSSLKNHYITFYHNENIPMNFHSKVRL